MIPKRVFWAAVGYGAGLGTSYWAARKVRATVRRYTPDTLADRVSGSVTDLRVNVGAAMTEGRSAMRVREAELRAGLRE